MGIHRLNRHQFHLKNLCDPARLPHDAQGPRRVASFSKNFGPVSLEGYHLGCLGINSKDGGWLYRASHSVFPLVRFALIHVSFILVRCVFSNRRCVLTRDLFLRTTLYLRVLLPTVCLRAEVRDIGLSICSLHFLSSTNESRCCKKTF